MVKVEDLYVSFGNEVIHHDLSFNVKKGEKLVITGDSGVGKSTLLNVLAGFIPDYKGKIWIDDLELNLENMLIIRQKIAWLPQNFALNVDKVHDLFFEPFNLEANKKNKPEKNDIHKIFDIFDLSNSLLHKDVDEISGGQKQRVLLASCLLLKKPLLLIDEPTSALDENIKVKVTDYILSQENLTVIAVTHDSYWRDQSDQILNLT